MTLRMSEMFHCHSIHASDTMRNPRDEKNFSGAKRLKGGRLWSVRRRCCRLTLAQTYLPIFISAQFKGLSGVDIIWLWANQRQITSNLAATKCNYTCRNGIMAERRGSWVAPVSCACAQANRRARMRSWFRKIARVAGYAWPPLLRTSL